MSVCDCGIIWVWRCCDLVFLMLRFVYFVLFLLVSSSLSLSRPQSLCPSTSHLSGCFIIPFCLLPFLLRESFGCERYIISIDWLLYIYSFSYISVRVLVACGFFADRGPCYYIPPSPRRMGCKLIYIIFLLPFVFLWSFWCLQVGGRWWRVEDWVLFST